MLEILNAFQTLMQLLSPSRVWCVVLSSRRSTVNVDGVLLQKESTAHLSLEMQMLCPTPCMVDNELLQVLNSSIA